MPIIKLHPGGTDRLNLLEAGPGDPARSVQNRQELMTGMLATVMRRDLDPVEETLLNTAIDVLDQHHRERLDDPTLVDLATLLGDLPESVCGIDELRLLSESEIAASVTNVRLALSKLLRSTLRGMFDGASTVSIEQMSGQGVVIDLSSVFSNPDALPLVQMATASTLAGQMAALPAQGRRGILVDDEVWATMASERAAKTLQSRLKLCRLWGIWNILDHPPPVRPERSSRQRHLRLQGRRGPPRRRPDPRRVPAGHRPASRHGPTASDERSDRRPPPATHPRPIGVDRRRQSSCRAARHRRQRS